MKIDKHINIAIVGLGYVGLPLCVEFGKFFKVTGYDLDDKRINELKNGYDRTNEIEDYQLLTNQKLSFTSSSKDIKNANVYIVTVPTPVDKENKPDLRAIKSASSTVGKFLSFFA